MDFDNALLNEELAVLDYMDSLVTDKDGMVFSDVDKNVENGLYIHKKNGVWIVEDNTTNNITIRFTNIYNLCRWYVNTYVNNWGIDIDSMPMILPRGTRVVIKDKRSQEGILYGNIVDYKVTVATDEHVYKYIVVGDDDKVYNCIWLKRGKPNLDADIYMECSEYDTYIRTLEDYAYNLREEINCYEAAQMDDDPVDEHIINGLYCNLEEVVEYINDYIDSKSSKTK